MPPVGFTYIYDISLPYVGSIKSIVTALPFIASILDLLNFSNFLSLGGQNTSLIDDSDFTKTIGNLKKSSSFNFLISSMLPMVKFKPTGCVPSMLGDEAILLLWFLNISIRPTSIQNGCVSS